MQRNARRTDEQIGRHKDIKQCNIIKSVFPLESKKRTSNYVHSDLEV